MIVPKKMRKPGQGSIYGSTRDGSGCVPRVAANGATPGGRVQRAARDNVGLRPGTAWPNLAGALRTCPAEKGRLASFEESLPADGTILRNVGPLSRARNTAVISRTRLRAVNVCSSPSVRARRSAKGTVDARRLGRHCRPSRSTVDPGRSPGLSLRGNDRSSWSGFAAVPDPAGS